MVYMAMVYGPLPDDLAQAFLIGSLIGGLCLVFEIFVYELALKDLSSYLVFILRFIWYQLCLYFAFCLGISVFNSVSLQQAFEAISPTDKIVAGWVVIAINFVIMVNRWLGHKSLWIFFSGMYQKPIFEERLLLFLKIPWTPNLETRDDFERHQQRLQDFIEHATDIILRTSGQIYRYEPDGILVTYDPESLSQVLECVLNLREEYPSPFQACLAHDNLSVSEIGDFRKEILILSKLFGNCLESLRANPSTHLVHKDLFLREIKPRLEDLKIFEDPGWETSGFCPVSDDHLSALYHQKELKPPQS